MAFGEKISKQFVDALEDGQDSRAAVNLHNNEAGRLVRYDFIYYYVFKTVNFDPTGLNAGERQNRAGLIVAFAMNSVSPSGNQSHHEESL